MVSLAEELSLIPKSNNTRRTALELAIFFSNTQFQSSARQSWLIVSTKMICNFHCQFKSHLTPCNRQRSKLEQYMHACSTMDICISYSYLYCISVSNWRTIETTVKNSVFIKRFRITNTAYLRVKPHVWHLSRYCLRYRSSRSQIFFKIGALKIFAIFIGKHLCWSLFLIKLKAFRPATLSRRNSSKGIFLWIVRSFQEQLFL